MGVGALVGGSLVSGLVGASSAKSAANAQERAAERAADAQLEATRLSVDEQRRQFDLARDDLGPYRDTGYDALAAMRYEMGLGPRPTFGGQPVAAPANALAAPAPLSNADKAINYRNDLGNGTYDLRFDDGSVRQFQICGGRVDDAQALNSQQARDLIANVQSEFQPEPVATEPTEVTEYRGFEATPGYQFRLDEGQKALERNASARGVRLSAEQMKDAMRYGEGLAASEYGDYYNRLAALAGTGQTAVNSGNAAGANAANQIQSATMTGAANRGNAYMAGGDAQAAGYLGMNNAFQGTMGNLFSIYAMNQAGAFGQPNADATSGGFYGGGNALAPQPLPTPSIYGFAG